MCVAESPLQFYVNHASSPNVTAYGPGLSYGVANKMATFTVFTEDASEGTLVTGRGGAAELVVILVTVSSDSSSTCDDSVFYIFTTRFSNRGICYKSCTSVTATKTLSIILKPQCVELEDI